MTAAIPDAHPRPGMREQNATRLAFFFAGLATSSWAPLVPLAKARIGLDEGRLGGLLLCLGLGSVLAMPFAGALAARFGCRKALLALGLVGCAVLPVMASAGTAALLGLSLLLFGAAMGTMDVTMNVQAVIVEKAADRSMMSGFHGLFSVGGIAGAGGVTALLTLGAPPLGAIGTVVALGGFVLAAAARGFLPYGGDGAAAAFALPRGRVLLLGVLCFVMFLGEGSVLDWSGVLLNADRHLEKGKAGIGFVAFATTMTLARLTGDVIVRALGPRRVIAYGGFCAAAGFALAALVPFWPISVLGFALVGIGAANVVPVLFSAAGRQHSMPVNLAVAAMASVGYAGHLAGPALIGFAAHATSLSLALLLVAAMLVGVALCSRAVTTEAA